MQCVVLKKVDRIERRGEPSPFGSICVPSGYLPAQGWTQRSANVKGIAVLILWSLRKGIIKPWMVNRIKNSNYSAYSRT